MCCLISQMKQTCRKCMSENAPEIGLTPAIKIPFATIYTFQSLEIFGPHRSQQYSTCIIYYPSLNCCPNVKELHHWKMEKNIFVWDHPNTWLPQMAHFWHEGYPVLPASYPCAFLYTSKVWQAFHSLCLTKLKTSVLCLVSTCSGLPKNKENKYE